jgi:oligopeptide transport system substrate-binding protein
MLLSLAVCSCLPEENQVKTLRMNLGSEPDTLDWNQAKDSMSFDIIVNLMQGLYRFNLTPAGEIVVEGACANSYEVSEDKLTYIYQLKPEAKWHDGMPVTAQHFIDSFKRTLDPLTAAPYSDLLSIIDLEKSTALSADQLKIVLKRPASYFKYLMASPFAYPIRHDLIEKYGNDWTKPEYIVTNGFFKLKSWQHEYKIVLERFSDYWQPSIGNVGRLKYFMVAEQSSAFTLFKNKQFDWIDGRSIPNSELSKIDFNGPLATKTPLLRNTYLGFNTKIKPFNDARVRKAFAYALDRQKLCKLQARESLANTTWIPPGLSFYHNKSKDLDYKPKLARKLLKQAGYNSKNFPEIKFLYPSREDAKILAEIMQSMWHEELGVPVTLVAKEWKVFLKELEDNTPHMFRLNWGADYPDPDTFMQLFTKNNSINHGKWFNPDYDKYIYQAGISLDPDLRRKLYLKAEKILIDDEMAISPLFVNTQILLKNSKIEGLTVNPMDVVFLEQVRVSK